MSKPPLSFFAGSPTTKNQEQNILIQTPRFVVTRRDISPCHESQVIVHCTNLSFFLSYASEMSEIIRDAQIHIPKQNQIYQYKIDKTWECSFSLVVDNCLRTKIQLLMRDSPPGLRRQIKNNIANHYNNTFDGILMWNAELLRHRWILTTTGWSRRHDRSSSGGSWRKTCQ